VALVSAAVLLLQIVQTRIFSVMLWHHLTYLVVTFTLLGFAAGGAVLACRRRWLTGNVDRRLSLLALLFGLTAVAAFVVVTRLLPHAEHTRGGIATAAFDYAILLPPMVLAGMIIALALADAGPAAGRTYAVNMAGSALGCLIYVPVLRALGGEGTVLLATSLAFAGAACFGAGATARWVRSLRGAGALLALGSLGFAIAAPTAVFETPVAPTKAMAQHMQLDPDLRVELTRWDPLCRIDVVGDPADPTAQRTIYQDGDAPTVMPMGHAEQKANILEKEGLAYLLFPPTHAPKVLAIGIGGGIDVVQAAAAARPLAYGQRVDFTGVEINPTTAGLMLRDFAAATGNRYKLPGVRVELDEGRSWLRRSPEKYDIIQMTGTDTYAALASGSYVMSESYLYTAEAYDDFLAHLTPDGVISVVRFRFEPPRETLRLTAIAVDALRRAGVQEPADHFIEIGFDGPKVDIAGEKVGLDYGALLIGRRPFRPDEVDRFVRYAAAGERTHLLYAPGLAPGVAPTGATADYFAAVRASTDEAFRQRYVYNLDPVTDDNPFFFRYDKWKPALARIFGWELDPQDRPSNEYSNIVGAEPIGLIMLGTVLVESSVLVALLVIVPLWLFRREGLAVAGAGRWTMYFFGLGAGYILVEIVAMQRFVLFLGNPGYAITTVLVTFLLFSALGSAVAARSPDPAVTLRGALLLVLLLILGLAVALPPIFSAALRLPLPLRLGLTVLLLAPPAFVMGMPFPSGLALLSRRGESFVPWAFGVNGGASVIASVVGILVAMAAGFSAAFALAGLAYAAALLAGRRAGRAAAAPAGTSVVPGATAGGPSAGRSAGPGGPGGPDAEVERPRADKRMA